MADVFENDPPTKISKLIIKCMRNGLQAHTVKKYGHCLNLKIQIKKRISSIIKKVVKIFHDPYKREKSKHIFKH